MVARSDDFVHAGVHSLYMTLVLGMHQVDDPSPSGDLAVFSGISGTAVTGSPWQSGFQIDN
jgi:hypothetical protein